MNAFRTIRSALLLAGLLCACPPARAASTSELLQQGLYAEEVEGNMDSAIKLYTQVARNGSATHAQVAQALYRQGMCYLKIKDEPAAKVALQKLITDFSDQTDLVEKARGVLEDLTNFDPAALMPAGTLIYVELGSPGKQVETILSMLKGTPFENPLASLGGQGGNGGQRSPADLASALLNPSMLAEFKKIRSSAVGITGFKRQGPPSMIAVLYPGKSDALRGVLLAALGMAGRPGETLEGLQTVTVQNMVGVAYDDKVIIAAQPAEQLAWSVRQYKSAINEPTLASQNASFSAINKKQRQEQALTVWVNADETYAKVLELFPDGKIPRQVLTANSFADFKNMDYLTASWTVEPDGLACKADLQFEDGHQSLAYDLIRSPNISKAGFDAVPSSAIAVASLGLSPADSAQAEKVRSKIQNVTGLDVGREIFANIEQATLFVMPSAGASWNGAAAIPQQLGLTLTSRNPVQTRQLLSKLLGTAEMIVSGNSENASGKYKVGRAGQNDIFCYLEQVNGMTILSLNRDVVDASIAAVKEHKSARTSGPMSKVINKLSPNASKLLAVNAGGAIRMIPRTINPADLSEDQKNELSSSIDQLARAADSATIELRTEEQLNNLSAAVCVSGMPPLKDVMGPAMRISRINEQVNAEGKARWLRQEAGALFAPAAGPPVIDGIVDDFWKASTAYKLENVVNGTRVSTNDLAAEYRAMWDKDKLYLLIDVTDSMLRHDPAVAWQNNDGIEIYIDAANSKLAAFGETDFQYTFNWDKTAPSLKELKHDHMEGVQFAQATTDKGYRVEIGIPWTTLGAKPVAGAKIGFDVAVNDSRGHERRDAKISWNDQRDAAWRSPQAFGNAQLGGLVGWWKFDESQGTTVSDSSGGNHNGTLIGKASWKPGKNGGALDLSPGSFVRIADKAAFDMANQVTIACWVNLRSVPAEWSAIVTKGDDSWRLSTSAQERRFHFAVDGDYAEAARINTPHEVNANEWHHVGAVYDGETMRLYVDGKLQATQEKKGVVGRNDFEVLIGGNAQREGRGFDGLLDDLRIYNCALPESRLMALAAGE